MKTLVLNFEDLANGKAIKAMQKAFARVGTFVVTAEADPKVKTSAGVKYKTLNLSFNDGQKVSLDAKSTGDVFQVRVNGKVTPIKNHENIDKAIVEIVNVLDKGRAKFQAKMTRVKVELPKGLKSTAKKQHELLKETVSELDMQIEEATQRRDELKAEMGLDSVALDAVSMKAISNFNFGDKVTQNRKHQDGTGKAKINSDVYDWAEKKFGTGKSYTITNKADAISKQEIKIHKPFRSSGVMTITVRPLGDVILVKKDTGGEDRSKEGEEAFELPRGASFDSAALDAADDSYRRACYELAKQFNKVINSDFDASESEKYDAMQKKYAGIIGNSALRKIEDIVSKNGIKLSPISYVAFDAVHPANVKAGDNVHHPKENRTGMVRRITGKGLEVRTTRGLETWAFDDVELVQDDEAFDGVALDGIKESFLKDYPEYNDKRYSITAKSGKVEVVFGEMKNIYRPLGKGAFGRHWDVIQQDFVGETGKALDGVINGTKSTEILLSQFKKRSHSDYDIEQLSEFVDVLKKGDVKKSYQAMNELDTAIREQLPDSLLQFFANQGFKMIGRIPRGGAFDYTGQPRDTNGQYAEGKQGSLKARANKVRFAVKKAFKNPFRG